MKMALAVASSWLLLLGPSRAAGPPPATFTYTWAVGALDAPGTGVAPAGQHTRQSAEDLCTALPLCRGFSYAGTNTSSGELPTMFTSDSRPNASKTGYSTWVKVGVVTEPALKVEVGSSNLTLELRASAFTVQSLGPTTDPWGQNFSFMRTLAGNSMPTQQHVGDITFRLQQDTTEPSTPGCTSTGWATYSSALGIGVPATPLNISGARILAAHDITPLLVRSAPNGSAPFPLEVRRVYEVSSDDTALIIR
jgi:hypothetical protein